jgi:hypothetical protein
MIFLMETKIFAVARIVNQVDPTGKSGGLYLRWKLGVSVDVIHVGMAIGFGVEEALPNL